MGAIFHVVVDSRSDGLFGGRDKLKFRRDKSERKSRGDGIEVKRNLGYAMNSKNI